MCFIATSNLFTRLLVHSPTRSYAFYVFLTSNLLTRQPVYSST